MKLLPLLILLTACAGDQELAQKHHCEMVALWEESSGELGWPDYNKTVDSYCQA